MSPEPKEHFELRVRPDLPDAVLTEYARVRALDIHHVAVLAKVMGQSVAMDSYKLDADRLLAQFDAVNERVRTNGGFGSSEKETLFQVVARNNSLFIDLIGKLGVMDRSDAAWNFSKYEVIDKGMKEEFEIDRRFAHIEYKLNLIQQNAKFFLEVLQSQKASSLEWIIIVLIAFECVLMCLDMTGAGASLFRDSAAQPPK